ATRSSANLLTQWVSAHAEACALLNIDRLVNRTAVGSQMPNPRRQSEVFSTRSSYEVQIHSNCRCLYGAGTFRSRSIRHFGPVQHTAGSAVRDRVVGSGFVSHGQPGLDG